MFCEQCKESINLNVTLYKGFDCEFCSKDCRLKFISFLKIKHCNLSNYKEWSPDKQKNKKVYTWDIDISTNKNKSKNKTATPTTENVSINNLEIKEECNNYIKKVKSNKPETLEIYDDYKTLNTTEIFNSIYDISYINVKECIQTAYEYTSKYFK